ncbi:hypothetical protein GCM10009001_30180 [Virgibacillus siamensis]|uniref:DUF3951 domain-containing protein n=1 Tax=Virgibacillus siamensis TaxID=480071 RepID=A0ABN1GGB9_9BACI
MFILPIFLVISLATVLTLMIFIACKIAITGKIPRSYYTPLEAAYGQDKEFHEEVQQEEQEDEDENGDDKDKNIKYPQ